MAKRRMPGEGTIGQRKDGMWRGQIDVGSVLVNGKLVRRRKAVYDKTAVGCRRKMDAALAARRSGDLSTSSLPLEKWLDVWLTDIAAKRVKPKTLRTYRSYVENHITPSIGRHRLDRLSPTHVRDLHRFMEDQPDLSSTTILHAHRILSAALTQAMREGRVVRNVASLVDAPRKAHSARQALSVNDAKAILTTASQDRLASRWLAAFLLGARQGEILGLRWEFVDLERGVVDLAWSLQRVPYVHGCKKPCGKREASCPARRLGVAPGLEHQVLDGNLCLLRPKTVGSRRVVPLAPPLVAALRLRRQEASTEDHTSEHDLVWCRPDGRPLDGRLDWKAWRSLLVTSGSPMVTLHEARHTTATLLLEGGVDAHVVASILGHSDVTTSRGYQHVDISLARLALTELGAQLELG